LERATRAISAPKCVSAGHKTAYFSISRFCWLQTVSALNLPLAAVRWGAGQSGPGFSGTVPSARQPRSAQAHRQALNGRRRWKMGRFMV